MGLPIGMTQIQEQLMKVVFPLYQVVFEVLMVVLTILGKARIYGVLLNLAVSTLGIEHCTSTIAICAGTTSAASLLVLLYVV